MSTSPRNLRTAPNPLVRAAGRALARLNARHPWDHNAHFHPWILRSLPEGAARVLDVGCGRGDLLATLHRRVPQVDGIDPDPGMALAAATALRGVPGVEVRRRSLAEHADDPRREGAYDAVVLVASLHHQRLAPALRSARWLLRPGGELLVVTLVRPETLGDQLWDIACALSNPLIGLVRHPRPVRATEAPDPAPAGAPMPVRDSELTLSALRAEAARQLPGARIRRREGFRVTLRWRRPDGSGLSAADARR